MLPKLAGIHAPYLTEIATLGSMTLRGWQFGMRVRTGRRSSRRPRARRQSLRTPCGAPETAIAAGAVLTRCATGEDSVTSRHLSAPEVATACSDSGAQREAQVQRDGWGRDVEGTLAVSTGPISQPRSFKRTWSSHCGVGPPSESEPCCFRHRCAMDLRSCGGPILGSARIDLQAPH